MSEPSIPPASQSGHAAAVGRFYDAHGDAFARVYGDVIQAFRTTDVTRLLDHEARSMGLVPGMKVFDAGCGVAGPAIHFARAFGVHVDAVTVSARQAGMATRKVADAGLGDRVTVSHADYHAPGPRFERGSYDVVCFLESFGHSDDKARAVDAAWDLLAPGGRLYIKDLFVREVADPKLQALIDENVRRIDEAYQYRVGDLHAILRLIRRRFILSAVRTVDIALEDFEDLTISNEFQRLTGIHRIDDLDAYLFPVDFFELVCLKPWQGPHDGNHRYFLQNLLHMQVDGVGPASP